MTKYNNKRYWPIGSAQFDDLDSAGFPDNTESADSSYRLIANVDGLTMPTPIAIARPSYLSAEEVPNWSNIDGMTHQEVLIVRRKKALSPTGSEGYYYPEAD